MLPKILLFSDLHLHTYRVFGLSKDNRMYRRLEEQINILDQITNILLTREINYVIFGGDLVHKVDGGVPIEALNVAKKYVDKWRKLGIKVFFVSGNHDQVNKTNPEWYETVSNLFVEEETIFPEIKLIGYSDKVDYETTKGYKLVVIHQTPVNAKYGKHEFKQGVNWKELEKHNDLIVFGHIHQSQKLSNKSYILGSPMALNFADTNPRGVYIFEEGKELEFIKLNYSEFITVDLPEQVIKDNNYYRVLNATNKLEGSNVVSIIKPKYFEEKLKGNTFQELLVEWLVNEKKDESYSSLISDIIPNEQTIKKVFKGKITKIIISDYLSIKYLEIQIPEGLIQVTGDNGSGKSTIFDAIYWCFFGKTTKKLINSDIIRDRPTQQDNAQVEIQIVSPNGGIGRIKRTSKEGLLIYKGLTSLESIVEGKTQDERQKMLQEALLGIPENLFMSACYFSQENLQMLTTLGDSDKTSLITNLLGFDVYDELYNKVHEKQKIFKEKKPILDKELIILTKDFEKLNELIAQLEKQINQLDLINLQEELQIKKLVLEKNNLIVKQETIQIIDYDKQIEDCKLERVKIQEKITEITKLKEIKLEEINLLTQEILKNSKTHLLEEIKKINLQIKKINLASSNTICEHCGSLVTEENKGKCIAEKQKEITILENKIIEMDLKTTQLNEKLVSAKLELAKLPPIPSLFENDLLITKLNTLKFEQIEKINELKNQEKDILNKKNILDLQITNLQEHIKIQKNQKEEINLKIISYISEKEIKILEKTKITNQILTLDSDILKLEFWKYSFSPRGIRANLLSKFCNEFNLIINKYIALISNGKMEINLNPDKELKNGEKRNELSLDIFTNSKKRRYQGLSGGQKRRVDLSICLALNKWVSNRYNLVNGLLGILILDEIISAIDPSYSESIANVLKGEAEDRAIFIVAHGSNIDANVDHTWNLRLNNEEITEITVVSN